ncbi:MAG: hypothetical protein ACTSO2_05640 [Promethearchaeota archaeon]
MYQQLQHISIPLIEKAILSYECKIIHTAESGKRENNIPQTLFR